MKKLLWATLSLLIVCVSAQAATWHVRTDGSSTTNCTGQANAAYDGGGTGEACAYASPQDAITAAARGDTISIQVANYNKTTPFNFPTKSGSFNGSNWITIQSANVGSLSSARVNNTTDVANMPTLTMTAGGQDLLSFPTGSTGWKLIGLHLTNNISSPASSSDTTPAMVAIVAGVSDLEFDRCVVHPKESPTVVTKWMTTGRYAFNQAGDNVTVKRSYIYDFFGRDPDAVKLQGMSTPVAITGISKASPAVITSPGHGLSSGDVVQIINAGGNMATTFQAKASGSITDDHVVTVTDGDHFTVPVNTSSLETFASTNAAFYKWPKIEAVTNANPAVFTVTGHGFSSGMKIRPRGLASTLGSTLNGSDYTITVINGNTFSIPVNTTSLSSYSGSGGYFKAEGSGQQTIVFGVGADVQNFLSENNFIGAWYAGMQTAGSDASPTVTTTVDASPTPTASGFRLASTTGVVVGKPIAVDVTHSDDQNKCPFGGQGGDRPCFGVCMVATVNHGTRDVTCDPYVTVKNGHGYRIAPHAAILTPGQANIDGKQPTNIDIKYSTIEIPVDFSEFHFATNGNTGKGVIEGKDCYDCEFEGNIVQGFPSSFSLTTANQNGSSPWMTTAFITIKNNWFKVYRTGVLLSATDYGSIATQGHDFLIHNNLFGSGVSSGDFIRVAGASANVTITHNTVVRTTAEGSTTESIASGPSNGPCTDNPLGGGTPCPGGSTFYAASKTTGVVFRDNLLPSAYYTAICYLFEDGGGGSAYLNCFTSPTATHNSFYINFAGADPLFQFPGTGNATIASKAAVAFVGSDLNVVTDWAVQDSSAANNSSSTSTDRGVIMSELLAALAFNDGFTQGVPITVCKWSSGCSDQ